MGAQHLYLNFSQLRQVYNYLFKLNIEIIKIAILNTNYNQLQMTTSTKSEPTENLKIWKVKLQLAAEGSYQAIQQVKQHILEDTDEKYPIFKQSVYDILQQGYDLFQLQPDFSFKTIYQSYKDIPLIFLLSGQVEVKCTNVEGKTQNIKEIKSKGVVSAEQSLLLQKYGYQNLNRLGNFQIIAKQYSILLEINGSNKLEQNIKRKEISEKQNNIMRKFMIFTSKQVVRVTINSTNQQNIKDRIYLLSGKACFYLDDQKQFGRKLILSCYQQGYLNPKQFCNQFKITDTGIPSSFKIQQKVKEQKNNKPNIKLYIFQQSQIMYLQQNFLKDDFIKAIQLKKQEHLNLIIGRYRQLKNNNQAIQKAQNLLINKYKLNKKQIISQIFKIIQSKKPKAIMTAKQSNDKKINSKTHLISTSSSIKCSIRIRKSKKIV